MSQREAHKLLVSSMYFSTYSSLLGLVVRVWSSVGDGVGLN